MGRPLGSKNKPKGTISPNVDFSELDKIVLSGIKAQDHAQLIYKKHKHALMYGPKAVFYRTIFLLGSQVYGPATEEYMRLRLGYNKVKSKNRGDFSSTDDIYFEEKGTFTKTNKYNLVQIRVWHIIDYYIFVLVKLDPNDEYSIVEHIYQVPACEVHNKVKEDKWSNAHLDENSNRVNENKERRITFYENDAMWNWLQQYRIEVKDLT